MSLRSTIKKHTPWPLHYLYRKLYYAPQDAAAAFGFLFHGTATPTTISERCRLIAAFYKISYYVDCPHTEHELITIARAILDLPPSVPGVIAEAGAFHGGSTAKLSLVARLAHRTLDVFDSFEGMPANAESGGASIYGREHHFPKGSHAVGLDEVRANVMRYGDIGRTEFHKGFFDQTMPHFKKQVAASCINVDLERSTRDCLRFLYPLTARGGIIISQDAHFPWIIALLRNDAFWKDELGIPRPSIPGLGTRKFVSFIKV